MDEHMSAGVHSTPPATQSELPQSPLTPRAKRTYSDDGAGVGDSVIYTVINTPRKGRRIVFHNKELDPDSVIPFRSPVLIKEKIATPRKPIEVPTIIQRWLNAPSPPSTTESRKSKLLNKEREEKVKKRLTVFSEPSIRENKNGSYEAVWEEVGRVLRPSQKEGTATLVATHVQISQQPNFEDPFLQAQWPDAQFPWSIADRELEVDDKLRRRRELNLIERYLASETEDGSEGDEDMQMPWIEVNRVPEKRANSKTSEANQPPKVWVPTDPSDALTALLSHQAARRVATKIKALEQPRAYKPPERPKGKPEEENLDPEEEELVKLKAKGKEKSPEKERPNENVSSLEREQFKSPAVILDGPMPLGVRSPTVSTSDGDKDADGEDVIACICKGGDDGRTMVQCDNCNTWHHLECVKKKPSEVRDKWYCWRCPEGENPRLGPQTMFSLNPSSATSLLPPKKSNIAVYQVPTLLQPSPIIEMSKRSASSTAPTPQSLMAPFYPIAPSPAAPHKMPPSKAAPLAKPGALLYAGPDPGVGTTPGAGPSVTGTPGGYQPPPLEDLAPIGVDMSPSRALGLRFVPPYPGFNPMAHGTPGGRRDPIMLPGVGLSGGPSPYYNAGRPWHNYPGPNFMTPQGPTRVQFAPYQAPQSTLPSVQTDPLFIHYEHDAPKTTAHHGVSVSGPAPAALARATRAARKKSKKSAGPGAESAEESRSGGSIGDGAGVGSSASGDMELTTTPPSVVVPLATEDVKMETDSTHTEPPHSSTMDDSPTSQTEPSH
jgi:PHD-finger